MGNDSRIDMMQGPLTSKILLFALPLAASSIMQQLFNAVDVAVVGRYASAEALAAVGSNSPVISLIINLFVGITVGANVIIANHIGQRDFAGIRKAIHTVGTVAVVTGLCLMMVGMIVARPILSLMGTPSDVIEMSTLYLRLYFAGIPFFMVFNFGAAILRSMGDTRRPLRCLAISGVVNTVLNLVLVIGCGLDVEGVAIATVVANILSATMIVRILIREVDPYRLSVRDLCLDRRELVKMLRIGLPAGVQGVVFSLANVVIQSTVNSFGSQAMAGSAAALNYEQFCYNVMLGFAAAATTFISQNYGAGQNDRCRQVFKRCMGLALVFCGALNIFIGWQCDFFISLFTSSPEAAHYATIRMHVALMLQFVACSYEIAGAALRGLGHSSLPALMTVFGSCGLRLVWVAAVCPAYPSFEMLMAVYPVSWVVTGVMVLVAYWVVGRRALR